MKRIIIIAIAIFGAFGVSFAENPQPTGQTSLQIKYHSTFNQGIGDRWKDFLEWDNFGAMTFYQGLGYVWSKGYPMGFNVGGLRLGFANDEIQYPVSADEYKVPTWCIHSMNIRGISLGGPFGVSLGLDVGLNMAKRYLVDPYDPSNYYSKTKVYFAVAPIVGINIFMFNAFVGYEFVPAFKEIQGMICGGGVTFHINN